MILARTRRTVAPLAFSAVVAATLIGCGSDGSGGSGSADDGPCATVVSADSGDARPILVPAANVTLSDPGTGDLAAAAFDPDRESRQEVTLETGSTEETLLSPDPVVSQEAGSAQHVALPLTARANCEGDDLRAEYSLSGPTAEQTGLRQAIGEMNGTTGSIAFGPGGQPTRLIILPPEDSGSQARQAVEQSLVQVASRWLTLPTEPIGTGARWQTVRRVEGAISVTQTIDAELVERTGDDGELLTIEYTIREEPVDNVFRIPGSTDTLEVTRFRMAGEGTTTVDLRSLLPVAGSLTMTGGRELVGDDPNAVIVQQTGFTASWTTDE